jgi:hypothetical protein
MRWRLAARDSSAVRVISG